ncbi:hypothetical protein [Alteriqipengyuania lutimaris]|uniref:Uncharacterized protein n=1 Tax=Alteriqipengyuania lutimaris TaxID=1538146 RepID=A0A395LGB0_9SPHN|nr:hypothetical protein [Alteriqipengyuania lutimaris]MBB3035297.1 hypothetical protein [Alteriqipengyuania lutimaris]RDS75886.1 hypothetical protein DL238_14505 [Alteriqipengyuania lutimaris]
MRIAIAATSALALALSVPLLAQGNGNGNGNGNPGAKANPGNGNGNGRANGNVANARGGPPAMRGNGNANRGNGGSPVAQRVNGNANANGAAIRDRVEREVEQRIDRGAGRVADAVKGDEVRRALDEYDRGDRGVRGFCPPGLAKKNNGCQPPGQAKKLGDNRFGDYYRSADSRFASDDWQYYDGYAYRPAGGGLIESLIPLVGGALFGGNQWPSSYENYRAPAYYGSYFGQEPDNRYYYADRTLFSVDPEDRAITGIAALLTGDDISVGQPLPSGYEVYNVPYQYRDRYRDGPDAMYRYSDGYVYRADPETRVVAAVIDLLT